MIFFSLILMESNFWVNKTIFPGGHESVIMSFYWCERLRECQGP